MAMQTLFKTSFAIALLAAVAACGGGGGGSGGGLFLPPSSGGGTPTPAPGGNAGNEDPANPGGGSPGTTLAVLRGVAATGAAFADAIVTVTDQTGATVCTTSTHTDGTFSCTLPAATRAPLVIRATRDDQSLYSTTASAATGTANVTPLTTIVVAQLAPDGNPASLAGAIQTQPDLVTAGTIQAQVSELVAALQPLLDTLGQSAIDVMSGALVADGTGQDKVLDSISVSVQPSGSSSNIEVTVKTVPTDNESPPVSITYNTSVPTPTLPAIPQSALATDIPTPAAVASLFQRMTACYALPLTTRVSSALNDTTNATGTAADVAAPACRTLFVKDDPANFLSNGYAVGRDASNNGAFSGLFRAGATGVAFDRGNVEFARSTPGEFVLSYRQLDRFGSVDNDTIIARHVDGVLKLTGNNHAYRVTLRAYSEDRELINAPAYSSFNTGYNISIDNRPGSTGSLFEKVVVSTPFNTTLTYYPQAGLSFLAVSKDGTPGNVVATSTVRLAGAFQNPDTPGTVRDKEDSLYFVAPGYTEAQLSAVPNQSVWKLEFFHKDGATDNVTQTYRTVSRAQTLGEIRQLKFAQLTDPQRAQMVASSSATGRFTFGAAGQAEPNFVDFSAEGDLDAWTVPLGALAPSSLGVHGRAPGNGARFNDSASVSTSARKGIVYCSKQGASDVHCDPTWQGQYANGTSVNLIDLWARNARQVEVSKKAGTYGFVE